MRAGQSNQNPRDRAEPVSERNGFQLQTLVSVLSGMLLRKRFSSWVCSLAVPHTFCDLGVKFSNVLFLSSSSDKWVYSVFASYGCCLG